MKKKVKQLLGVVLVGMMTLCLLVPLVGDAKVEYQVNHSHEDVFEQCDGDGCICDEHEIFGCEEVDCKDCSSFACNDSDTMGLSHSSSVGAHVSLQAACSHPSSKLVVYKNATCTETGKKIYVCKTCNAQIYGAPVVTIPKLGHKVEQVTTKSPTCGASGTYVYKCTRPGCTYTTPNGGYIPPTGKHYWQYNSTVQPTCTAEGKHIFKCLYCGGTKTEKISKTAHKFYVDDCPDNCGGVGYVRYRCSVCGTYEYRQETIQHKYIVKERNGQVVVECGRCGKAHPNKLEMKDFIPFLYNSELNNWNKASDAAKKNATSLWLRYYYLIDKASADASISSALSFNSKERSKAATVYVSTDEFRKLASALYTIHSKVFDTSNKNLSLGFTALSWCRAVYDAYDKGSLSPAFAQGMNQLLTTVCPPAGGVLALKSLINIFGSQMDKIINDAINCYYDNLAKVLESFDKLYLESYVFGGRDMVNVSSDEFLQKIDKVWEWVVEGEYTDKNTQVKVQVFVQLLKKYGGLDNVNIQVYLQKMKS